MPKFKRLEELSPKEVEAWQAAYVKAKKEGAPMATLAGWLVRQQEAPVLRGESLDMYIPDRSMLVGPTGSSPILRQADWIMSPQTPGLKLFIETTEEPAEVYQGIEIKPPMLKKVKIAAQFICDFCKDYGDKVGWKLVDVPGEPNAVTQCPTCRSYHWLQLTRKEQNENA